VARKQLADTGSAGLSLRAVARDLGMASSAVYRYFPSRDELLTALIIDAYSAIPGYRAPQDTIDPAARIPALLIQIVADAEATGRRSAPLKLPATVQADLQALSAQIAPRLDESTLARAAMGWMQLIGSISFELFGHLNNVIHAYADYFEFQMNVVAAELGL
jgi:AcrR family transcriptional regulator